VNVYLDSSAIVKLFDSREPFHDHLRKGLAELAPEFQFTSVLAFPECLAAFASKDYSAAKLNKINALFLHAWTRTTRRSTSTRKSATPRAFSSGPIARGLRGADSVHLASAIRVGTRRSALTFAVFDRKLAMAPAPKDSPVDQPFLRAVSHY